MTVLQPTMQEFETSACAKDCYRQLTRNWRIARDSEPRRIFFIPR